MHDKEKKINKLFIYWLCTSLILVYFTILIGGLTRLTDSGLSITEWELFKGILPPLTDKSWYLYFEAYKKIPQYELINSNMSLSEFKVIFYWEYFHRMIARIIGLFFMIPLIFFYLSKKINRRYLNTCLVILILIVFQGVVGWYMVKSGLVNDVTVSHYRLSIHLSTAVLIISTMFWLIRNVSSNNTKLFFRFDIGNIFFQLLIFIIFIQIIMGAFVSGLDAGKIYQTWPLMGENFLPNDLSILTFKNIIDFNDHSLMQFYHRNLAYFLILYVLIMTLFIYKKKISFLYKPLNILLVFLFLQVFLGIYTLISGLNIYLASAHQITSVLLIFSALNLYYLKTK
tara:strand:- start:6569 stop:7594 length:1026 start_codon:yes stop_codon:yes gene_type:complete